jgi:TonB-linked SusC/RagA family outer membrane protein
MVGFLLTASANSYSQNTRLNIKLTDGTVTELMKYVEDNSEFVFLYKNEDLDLKKKVTVELENATIQQVLDAGFAGQNVGYDVYDRQIIIHRALAKRMPAENIQQQRTVTGVVTDQSGQPLPGVTVVVAGTTTGTVTNSDGNFSLAIPDGAETLQFSFVGMRTQEVPIEGRTTFTVVMEEETIGMEEVVVVGYGTQRKVNLTGAVDQVTGEDFEGRNISNITQGLQGVMANVNIRPLDGKPIESPTINIRGSGSIGQGGDALILIDGIEGDPSMLNPNDIESISVLKDAASAAIYGARGVFGVVLITTKSPQSDVLTIEYSANYAIKSPIIKPDYVTDGYTFAKGFNDAYFNRNQIYPRQINKTQLFSQEYLAELKRRSEDPSLPKTELDANGNYVYYHSTDWYGELYKDNFGSTEHNVTVSGGGEKTRFMISGRYNGQPGLYRYSSDDYKMYNLRAKGSIDLFPWLTLENNFDYSDRYYFNPLNVGEGSSLQRNIADEGHPTAPLLNPDGTISYSAAYTVGDMYLGYNGSHLDRAVLRNTTAFASKFFNNRLRAYGNFSFQNTDSRELRVRTPTPYSPAPGVIEYVGTNRNDIENTLEKTAYIATNIYTEFEDYFADVHYLKALIGYNYEESTWQRHRYSRNELLFPTVRDVNLAVGDNVLASGGYQRWRIAGGFFRLNYIFDNRYLIEFNGRYDGSSKFPTDQMFAFFPSVSAAWRISEENFWNVPYEVVSDLKFRASYGSLGNANISAYNFIEQFSIGTAIILDGSRPRKTSMPAVLPDGLTWETATTRNFGIDLGLVDNKLQFTGDAYVRKTTDMYTIGMTLPATFGTTSPKGNYADMETRGWEVVLSWNDRISTGNKPVGYNIRFSLSDWKAEILRYNNPEKFLNDYYEGMGVGEVWGYVTEGFFTSPEDVANHADQQSQFPPRTGIYQPGDIKFIDLNNDGAINPGKNTVEDPGDRKIIGNLTPRYTFGANLGATWNSFSFSAFFQGVGKQDWYPHQEAANFWGQYNRPYGDIPKWHLNDGIIWSEDDPDTFLPRYVARGGTGGLLRQTQSKYLMNAAYIRLKNVQLGYDLPNTLISRIGMSAAKIYVSGESLFTWSPLYKYVKNQIDVENATAPSDQMYTSGNSGDGYNYPLLKSITFGINVKF